MALTSSLAERIPDKVFASAIAYAHRRFEPILSQVRMFVDPHQTAVDVGAWYGPWTYWLSRVARSVVTVEANPELADFVARTAPSNVTVVPKAASDTAGTARLWLPPGGRGTEGRASLLRPTGRDAAGASAAEGRAVDVETIRLDSLDLRDVGLIKVDVEGHELAVLRGAEGLVRRFRPVLVVEVEDARSPAADTLDLLASWGYEGTFHLDGVWHRLEGFDLVGHQRGMEAVAQHGYLRAVAEGAGDSYVNTIVFRPRAARI
ncbi:FkbM family methyltransferase [Frankia sp. Mgl5]|uniref:FkbM family methyltransferase n=1 Tax=Frankia sp. Mgl5 TaxID=2933793 RepID=UPI002010BE1F|nr:FkbM family methyltransferase [Frankia sp. Mgl5]MCK9929525.1 FkbM family methyltransferase [Frankia sp. Mgl5]